MNLIIEVVVTDRFHCTNEASVAGHNFYYLLLCNPFSKMWYMNGLMDIKKGRSNTCVAICMYISMFIYLYSYDFASFIHDII